MDKLEKQIVNKNYLIGINKEGLKVWMSSPSWDCGWYWGFGYIKTKYSHSHYDGLVWHKNQKGDYIYHINECEELTATTLTDSEAWELSDLMKRFYVLRDAAGIYGRGNAHFTSNTGLDSSNKDICNRINTVDIPAITKRVLEILTPSK